MAKYYPLTFVHKMSRYRRWRFTLNNPEVETLDALAAHPTVTFLVYQLEKGEEGTPHFQGYFELSKAVKLVTIKRKYPNCARMNLGRCNGSQEDNIKYCTKDETRVSLSAITLEIIIKTN